MVMMRW